MRLKIVVSVAALAVILGASMSATAAEPPDWENPGVFAVGKEPADATMTVYADVPSALKGKREAATRRRTRSGYSWLVCSSVADRVAAALP